MKYEKKNFAEEKPMTYAEVCISAIHGLVLLGYSFKEANRIVAGRSWFEKRRKSVSWQ